jgi:hypothetical protein
MDWIHPVQDKGPVEDYCEDGSESGSNIKRGIS